MHAYNIHKIVMKFWEIIDYTFMKVRIQIYLRKYTGKIKNFNIIK